MNRILRHSLPIALLLALALPVYGQDAPSQQAPVQTRTPGVYQRIAHPGESTIPVIVMGLGGQGLYEVGESVELDELLVLSGGTGLNPKANKITIRLYRDQGGQRAVAYEAPLERMLVDQAAYPNLQPGDMLYVESRPRRQWGWRDIFTLSTGISSLILLYYRLTGQR